MGKEMVHTEKSCGKFIITCGKFAHFTLKRTNFVALLYRGIV